MQHHPRSSRSGGSQAARSDQRQHVVHVDDVGPQAVDGGGNIGLVAATTQQRSRGAGAARFARKALEQGVLDTRPAQRPQLQLDRPLLPALGPVAVVDDEHTHRRGRDAIPADGRAWRSTVVVPTRGRAAYLEVTLDSLLRQRTGAAYESCSSLDDGSTDRTREVAARHDVRCVSHSLPRSLNAARNTGVREAHAALIAFVDDDVLVPAGLGGGARARRRAHTPRRRPSAGRSRALRGPHPCAAAGGEDPTDHLTRSRS